MRCATLCCAALLATMLSRPVLADDAKDDAPQRKPKAGAGDREEMRRRMMAEFDKDGDGKLSDEEREKAREFRQKRMQERGRGDGDRRPPRGAEGQRPEGRGPGGPGGPGAMPDPMRLFEQFDADSDGQLSREEFQKLTRFIREHRASHGPGGPHAGPGRPGDGRGPGRPPGARDGERPRRPDAERRRPAEGRQRGDAAKKKQADDSTT